MSTCNTSSSTSPDTAIQSTVTGMWRAVGEFSTSVNAHLPVPSPPMLSSTANALGRETRTVLPSVVLFN